MKQTADMVSRENKTAYKDSENNCKQCVEEKISIIDILKC